MLLNSLFVSLFFLNALCAASLDATHHHRDSHLTCGYANSSIAVKYPSHHTPSQVLVYKYSEVETDTSRLLPWHHSAIMTCRLKKGSVQCTKYYPDGEFADRFFPGKHSSIDWNTITTKEFDYTVKEPGFYCVNTTINTPDEQPVVLFGQKSKSGWGKTMRTAGVVADFALNIAVFMMIWGKYNTSISQNRSLQVATTAMGCLLVAKVLGITQWWYFSTGSLTTTKVLTHVFSGFAKGLAASGFVGSLLLLAFEVDGSDWKSLAKILLPVCLPVFLLTYVDSILLASYDAPRLPLYYPEGYRGWFPVISVLILAIPAGYYSVKKDVSILRGPEKVISLLASLLVIYGVYWVAVVLRVFMSKSTYLDSAAQPPLVQSLRVIEWFLKAVLPAIALWSLATKGKDSAFDSERQPLVRQPLTTS